MALFAEAMPGRPASAVDRAFGEALRALQDGRIHSFEEGLFHRNRACPHVVPLRVLDSRSAVST